MIVAEIGVGHVLDQSVGDVDPEPVDAAVEPEPEDVLELLDAPRGWSSRGRAGSWSNRWRYHSPSGRRSQAGPPNTDSQSVGGSAPSGPLAGTDVVAGARRVTDRRAMASWNQACWLEVWLGTRSTMTRDAVVVGLRR